MDFLETTFAQSHDRRGYSRREALVRIVAGSVAWSVSARLMAQAPPPPPPPRGSVRTSGILPTTTDLMYAQRQNNEFERDEAARLERLISNTLANQRRLLLDFGINPDYEFPDIRLSHRDAKELNDEMDDVMERAKRDANDFLSRAQMSQFRKLLQQEASMRRSAINALRR